MSDRHAGRPLGSVERHHFRAKNVEWGTTAFDCPSITRKTSDWNAALRHIIDKSVMLRTSIVGNTDAVGDNQLRFALDESADGLFELTMIHIEASLDNEKEAVEDKLQQHLKPMLATLDGVSTADEIMRRPGHVIVALARKRVSITFVMPHCFADGNCIATIGTMLIAYVYTPWMLWPLLDLLCPADHPSAVEMTAKAEYPALVAKYGQELQAMPPTDNGLPNASDLFKLPSCDAKQMFHWRRTIRLNKQHTHQLKAAIRAQGLKVTPIFQAWTARLLMLLLQRHSKTFSDKSLQKTMLSMTPVDNRKLGKWNDIRDKHWSFPVLGDYTSAFFTPLHIGELLDKPLETSAMKISDRIDRLKRSVEFRVGLAREFSLPDCGYYAGISSIQMPTLVLKYLNVTNVDISPGGNPLLKPVVWAFVVSTMDEIHVRLGLRLPLENVTEADIKKSLIDSTKGTCIELVGTAPMKTNFA